MPQKTYYEILGVSPTASQEEIKKAFRERSKEFHPNAHIDEPREVIAELEEMMKEVTAAYSILSDASSRQKYDAKLSRTSRNVHIPKTQAQSPSSTDSKDNNVGNMATEELLEKIEELLRSVRTSSSKSTANDLDQDILRKIKIALDNMTETNTEERSEDFGSFNKTYTDYKANEKYNYSEDLKYNQRIKY